MNEASFRRMLRSALMLSLASCGGRIEGVTNNDGDPSAPTSTTTSTATPPSRPPAPPSTDNPPPPPPKDAGKDGAPCDEAKLPTDDYCTKHVAAPCSLPEDAGWLDQGECTKLCPSSDGGAGNTPYFCNVQKDLSGARYVACNYCVIGRRPAGLGACAAAEGDALGVFFAGASQLEAASVDAFENLERDLEEHGAPSELRERARRAALDEVRHAKTTASLARRFGARPGAWSDAPPVDPRRARSLEDVAIENATEGCVRETFGALVGMWQAERAEDDAVRRAMRIIARDESRHAALAWSVLGWIEDELDEAARARVRAAMDDALATLARDVVVEPSAELRTRAGLPSAREAAVLVAEFRRTMPSLRSVSPT